MEAPLEESKLKVMLELTGVESCEDRAGLDLVMVLDVSGSMAGQKLAIMKIAMKFVIKKLSTIDRLAVVTFNRDSQILCMLRQITEKSQMEIENLVDAIVSRGSTNITAGLQTGIKILNDRRLTSGRVSGIMLMSDGEQSVGSDAVQVPIGNVPVYTFGFGSDHDPKVLKAISDNSAGGTFSDVENQYNLTIAFSQCLAGLLTVVVQDLMLLHPAVSSRTVVDILQIAYMTYGWKPFEANTKIVSIARIGTLTGLEREEVMIEEKRLLTAQMMKEAIYMADDGKLEDARGKLLGAENLLDDVLDGSNPLIEMLKYELNQLVKLIESPEIYQKQGRSFALSSESSHDRQRFATRGDVEKMRLFATPRMDTYLEQAQSFDDDPSKSPPTVNEDVKQELTPNPLDSIVDSAGEEFEDIAGKIKLTIIKKTEAPLEESKLKVLVELTGVGSCDDRAGLDLVMVLDVSGSMAGQKLANMKIAMKFVIEKLSPIDRLAVVTFNHKSQRLCMLCHITENSPMEMENLVNDIYARGSKNITAGLQTGIKILNDRSFTKGRASGIMLMSDGEQTVGSDAVRVPICNMPIYTFGFGSDHDPRVLKAISDNSAGGMFSDVENLTITFSQFLSGLLAVVVKDLRLTITPEESTIEKIYAGNYQQYRDDASSSSPITVFFGDLYDKGQRKVLVDLLLPAVSSQTVADILQL